MWRWRLGCGIVLSGLLGAPVFFVFVKLAHDPAAWSVWKEGDRLAALGFDSLVLVIGSVLLALPVGIAGAFLLDRTRCPARKAYFGF